MDTTLWDVYINRGLCFIHAHIHKSPDVFISLQRPAFLSSIFSKLLYLLYFIFFCLFCFFSLSVSFSRLFFQLFSLSLFHRDDGREKREGGLSQRNVLNSFRYYSPPGFLPFRRISYLIFEAHRKKKKYFFPKCLYRQFHIGAWWWCCKTRVFCNMYKSIRCIITSICYVPYLVIYWLSSTGSEYTNGISF